MHIDSKMPLFHFKLIITAICFLITSHVTNCSTSSEELNSYSADNAALGVSDTMADHACNLRIQFENELNTLSTPPATDSSSTVNSDDAINVFVGNGYFYDLGCQFADAKMKPNDRYYVIDLVVYQPNSRVAKAWREQFNTASLLRSASRLLALTKKASFHSVGVNTVVCSVSKYNNVLNKFTRLCQQTVRINATEKTAASPLDKSSMQQPMSYLDMLFVSSRLNRTQPLGAQSGPLNELEKLILKQKLVWSTNGSFLASLLSTANSSNSSSNSGVPLTTQPVPFMPAEDNIDMDYETGASAGNSSSSSSESGLNAKAMQFQRNVNEASSSNKKNSLLHDSKSSLNSATGRTTSIMQPLLIILVFFIIFSISIGTIAYLTYHQKSSASTIAGDDYSSVKQQDAEDATASDTSQATSTANSMSRKSKLSINTPNTSAHHDRMVATSGGGATFSNTQNHSLCSASQISSTFSASDCNETNKLNSSSANDEDEINDLKIRHKL
jgi:hypothetical protein